MGNCYYNKNFPLCLNFKNESITLRGQIYQVCSSCRVSTLFSICRCNVVTSWSSRSPKPPSMYHGWGWHGGGCSGWTFNHFYSCTEDWYSTTWQLMPSLPQPSNLSPIQAQRGCQDKLYLTSTLPDSLHSTQARHSSLGGCNPQVQGSQMILSIGSLKGNGRARMADIDGDQERYKAALAPNSHHIVFVINRAASPFYRAFHSASLTCLLKGIQSQKFLFLFIEEGHQRGCNDLIEFSAGKQVAQFSYPKFSSSLQAT